MNGLSVGRETSVAAQEIGALRFRLAPNVRVVDEMLLVMANPTPGRFPSRADLIALQEPEFLLESHPHSPDHTPEQVAGQMERLRPDFHLVYAGRDGRELRYNVVERIRNEYGLVVLFQR